MAHPSTPAGAIAARLFRAAVLSVASLLLSTCARDVTAPPAPTQLAFLQQPENLLAGHQFSQGGKVRADEAPRRLPRAAPHPVSARFRPPQLHPPASMVGRRAR